MFNGVLRNLVTNTADDVAASAARKAMGKSVLSTIIPEERILQRAPEGFKIPAAAAQYLDNPQLPAPKVEAPQPARKVFTSEQGHPISDMPTEVIKTDGGYVRILPTAHTLLKT